MTFVYKGMLTTPQLRAFYLDLQDDRLESALGIVHSRFSTNTFPSSAARASVPPGRAQRRDRHRDRQRELDACPRGPDPYRRVRLSQRLEQDLPGLHAGSLRHRPIRRGARTVAPGRPQHCARGADDDPRGLGAQRVDGRASTRFLSVPRLADGTLGRPGVGVFHRRFGRRGGARP